MSHIFVSFRQSLVCLIACLSFLQTSTSLAETWREVQSPHFRVITDGSDRDGRDVAKEFEQMRSVFAGHFSDTAVEIGAPLLVVAVREPGLHSLAPGLWKDRDRIAGEFFRGWERQYALVRLDSFGDLKQTVVFHEYSHSILHANLHWLPGWLDEGMAEFYAYTRFQGDRVYVGAPSVRLANVQNETLIPLSEMLKANGWTFEKDLRRNNLFYGEAWLMVHYMTFGPDMGGGAKLNKFISLLQTSMSQQQAFQQVFGDQRTFEQNLSVYRSKFTMSAARLPPAPGTDEKSFPVKVLTPAEVDYDLGSFDVGVHDPVEGKKRLQAAISIDPSLAGPHEDLGFLAWREGHDEEARAEWQKAVAADPSSYRSAFALLMSVTSINQQSQPQLEQTQQALEAIKEKGPRFAPVFVELAIIQLRLGHLAQAYKNSQTAENLEPWRAGYHLLSGYILLQDHQPKIAEGYARTVAARWTGADHDEAVDLWNLLPIDKRGDGPALIFETPQDATVARGTIVSSACDKGLNLVFQPNTPNSQPIKLIATGRYESGFSDTLWVGEDHYTSCFHLAGLTAIVAYKPDATAPGKLLELEVRDSLPSSTPSAPAPKTAEVAKPQPSHP